MKYGLRFAAGFGSQIGLSFVRAWPIEGERINGQRLLTWCRNLAGSQDIQLRVLDNKLVAYVDGDNNLHGGIQGEPYSITAPFEGLPSEPVEVQKPSTEVPSPSPEPEVVVETAPAPAPISTPASGDMVQTVIDVVVKHTGYPADFVELDQDLEGELGIDTVKQAEIMVDIRQQFNLPVDETFVLSEHPTLNHMIGYIQRMQGGEATVVAPAPMAEPEPPAPIPETPQAVAPVAVSLVSDEAMAQQVIDVVVKHTGYPADFIELDQDLEGELGIDTVKQAEIMVDIRQLFNLPVDEDFLLSEHPTLNHMIAYIARMTGGDVVVSTPVTTTPVASEPVQEQAPPHAESSAPMATDAGIEASLVEVVVKHTGYPADFIEMDQDLEGELGIDTVKQAEIMVDVREIFNLPVDEDFLLSDHPTLNQFDAYIL